jgi:Putative esterase
VAAGGAYNVTVKTNPSGQSCTVSAGSGTVASANVTSVAVSCAASASYSIGGTVSGLSGAVVLQDNGGDSLSVTSNGPFTFATPVAAGGAYNVTVKTNPSGQSCTVSAGSGTVASANVTSVAVSCAGNSATSASDSFSRPDGPLGPNWTDISDGGLAISSGVVSGKAGQLTGDVWTANTFNSDQFSQVQVTSTQLTGGQWVGAAVRAQSGGQTGYVGIYYWNSGSPELMLFKRSGGSWSEIDGGARSVSPLAAGTRLQLQAVGSTIYFMENGIVEISVSDSSITGGAPGIVAFGSGTGGSWSGGNTAGIPRFQATYMSTGANGIESYQVISSDNGPDPQVVRVLRPTNPAAGVPHNFLYVLPVEAGLASNFGDPMGTLYGLNAQNQYNLTIIEPTFGIDPWYADNPTDPNIQYESYLSQDLVPWVGKNLATSGNEQNWLIGFSKSGIGGQDLILKHPDIFTLAATWDFPADMSSYDYSGADSEASYGTDANFQANYRLTQAFVDAHKAPVLSNNRIWIGGYSLFQQDMSDYDALLTSEGIAHTTGTPQNMAHTWDSGWVPIALAALHQDSINLH